jgi:hypothetical protein
MVRKVDEARMSTADASALFPNSYILMKTEEGVYGEGIVTYEADTMAAAYEKLKVLENEKAYAVLEGINLYKNCIGGVCIECPQ